MNRFSKKFQKSHFRIIFDYVCQEEIFLKKMESVTHISVLTLTSYKVLEKTNEPTPKKRKNCPKEGRTGRRNDRS